MADENEKISFLLDLDVSEFTEKGLKAKGIIEQLGQSESLSELTEGLLAAAPVLAALGASAFAFKQALDLTIEAEEINKINEQFETLAVNAGIAPEKLRTGLEKASSGLIDTTKLTKLANESIVQMGKGAERLPELMEIAKKATQVYGGTTEDVFKSLTQSLASGRTTMLKQYGIIVDSTKAVNDFAKAHNTTADQLTQTAKNQAILNAALDAGNERYKNVVFDSNEAENVLQELKATFTDIGEVFTIVFGKTIGPYMKSFLGVVRDASHTAKDFLLETFGNGAEQASAKADSLNNKINSLNKELKDLEAGHQGFFSKLFGKSPEQQIASVKAQIADAQTQLAAVEKQKEENEKKDEERNSKALSEANKRNEQSLIDQEKKKKNEQNFRKELDKIDQQYFKEQQSNVQSVAQVDQLVKKQQELLERQHQANLETIRNNASLNQKQKKQLEELENKRFNEQMENNEENSVTFRLKLLDNYAKNSKTVYDGITREFMSNSAKMKADMEDFSKRGTEMWNSLNSNATTTFQNIGAAMVQQKDVGKSVTDALLGFFLGFLGDRAIAEGNVMLAAYAYPPNIPGIAAGAGLITLGGALKAAAGALGNSTPSTAAAGPSPQSVGAGTAPALQPVSTPSSAANGGAQQSSLQNNLVQPTTQRTVQINIAGNYLETDQTKRMLMDLMRQESDATGFSYNQIGA